MAKTETKKTKQRNPNMKENLCCVLFFLLLPTFALVNSYSVLGCVVLGVTAALMITLYVAVIPSDRQLAFSEFGQYLTVSMISVLLINFFYVLPGAEFYFNIDANSEYFEHTPAGLLLAAVCVALKIFVFKKYKTSERNQLIRMVLDHLMVGSLFYGLMITFQEYAFGETNPLLVMMAIFTMLYILFDSYHFYRTGNKKYHEVNVGMSILLYILMLAGMLLIRGVTTVDLLYGRFFDLLETQMQQNFLVFVIPMLIALISYIVCFKGPYAASEVRILAVYTLFMLPIYLITKGGELKFGWMLGFTHTAILAFALFYKGNAGGKLEKAFATHKEYRVAISGILLCICAVLMLQAAYPAMVALIAFALVMIFILTRSKSVPGKVIWQVAVAGFAVLSVAVLLSIMQPLKIVLAAVMLWFISAAAIYLFTRGKSQKNDKWINLAIGISSFALQLVLCLSML